MPSRSPVSALRKHSNSCRPFPQAAFLCLTICSGESPIIIFFRLFRLPNAFLNTERRANLSFIFFLASQMGISLFFRLPDAFFNTERRAILNLFSLFSDEFPFLPRPGTSARRQQGAINQASPTSPRRRDGQAIDKRGAIAMQKASKTPTAERCPSPLLGAESLPGRPCKRVLSPPGPSLLLRRRKSCAARRRGQNASAAAR